MERYFILKNEFVINKMEIIWSHFFLLFVWSSLSPWPTGYASGTNHIKVDIVQFKMAQEYFKPAAGGLLVDVSCGSGLFSRKFAESGTYSGVVALDFSENMLRQCYDFIKKDNPSLTT